MSDKVYATGRTVLKALLASEEKIDSSIVENAKLIIAIIEGRKTIGQSVAVGHDAVMSAISAQADLAKARHKTVTCHEQLVGVREDLGLSPTALGCTSDCLTTARAQTKPRLVSVA